VLEREALATALEGELGVVQSTVSTILRQGGLGGKLVPVQKQRRRSSTCELRARSAIPCRHPFAPEARRPAGAAQGGRQRRSTA
jgi:hypothetical protein